jgi:hypothetical protein
MKRYVGVRAIEEGKVYEINFRPFKKADRVFRRVEATSKQEASIKRSDLMVKAGKETSEGKIDYSGLDFSKALEDLISDVMADDRSGTTEANFRKKAGKYRNVFNRMFHDFKNLKFPTITTPSQLTLPFFTHYKNYYCNELGKARGWRQELTTIKALIRRLYKLGYCNEQVIVALREIKKPPATQKEYPDIPEDKMRELFNFIKRDRMDMFRPIYFMLRTGRRVEETTKIERRDVKWKQIG